MEEPFEEVYFNWLYSKVASVDNPSPSLTHYTLLRDLHSTEFVWLISGDDNRAEDGLEVRKEFIKATYLDDDIPWMIIPCSVLEMLIAFSRRASFETEQSSREWFWIFIENLGLDDLNDARNGITSRVSETLDHMVWRTYRRDGLGGLFPLNRPDRDQRKVEIFYQFCAYLVEQEQL